MKALCVVLLLVETWAAIALISGHKNDYPDGPQTGPASIADSAPTNDINHPELASPKFEPASSVASDKVLKDEDAPNIDSVDSDFNTFMSPTPANQEFSDNQDDPMSTASAENDFMPGTNNRQQKYIVFPFMSPLDALQYENKYPEGPIKDHYNKAPEDSYRDKEAWAQGEYFVRDDLPRYHPLGRFSSEEDKLMQASAPEYYAFKKKTTKPKVPQTSPATDIFMNESKKTCPSDTFKSIYHKEDNQPKEKVETKSGRKEDEAFNNTEWMRVHMTDHKFYLSAVFLNATHFQEHWQNITSGAERMVVHPTNSSKASKHSYVKKLQFIFPFYGHDLMNITMSTNGFIHTGPSGLRWAGNTQSISPLMANFDTSVSNSCGVVLYEDSNKLTIVWENVSLHDRPDAKFTFAATLYKNGDIVYSYKEVPVKVQELEHKPVPLFIGLSDAYYLTKVTFYVRRKSIHTYHRISFKESDIANGTIIKIFPQKSCPSHKTCKKCTSHHMVHDNFECVWCAKLNKCSSGQDYNKPYMAECNFEDTCGIAGGQSNGDTESNVFNNLFKFAM